MSNKLELDRCVHKTRIKTVEVVSSLLFWIEWSENTLDWLFCFSRTVGDLLPSTPWREFYPSVVLPTAPKEKRYTRTVLCLRLRGEDLDPTGLTDQTDYLGYRHCKTLKIPTRYLQNVEGGHREFTDENITILESVGSVVRHLSGFVYLSDTHLYGQPLARLEGQSSITVVSGVLTR